jgi:hypothetical protein
MLSQLSLLMGILFGSNLESSPTQFFPPSSVHPRHQTLTNAKWLFPQNPSFSLDRLVHFVPGHPTPLCSF